VDIAALLAAGLTHIDVVKKPKVAIVPTGDELVATQEELKPGAILDVNSHMLAAAITQWGGEASRLAIIKDDRQAIKRALFACLKVSDMVIINAGTSAGTEDYTVDVLEELGDVLVHGVAIKPGRPVILAICQGKPVIGLPGYPVSAMLTAELFVRDILLVRQKLSRPEVSKMEATLAKQVASTVGVEEYIRVSVGEVQGKMVVAPLSRGAGLISSLTKAQGIISIEQSSSGLNAGATVPVTLLYDSRPADTILAVGSHDLALELLGVFLRRRNDNIFLSCANVGSMGGVMAIRNNEAHIAGVHLLDDKTGRYNIAYVEKFLPNLSWHLVHLAMRQQGLMVMPGNPKSIEGLGDLVRADVTFINRQRGSGTRMLLDYELSKGGFSYDQVAGYEKEVGTHMAVAASVAGGAADTGLGVQAAAVALGLDFIPVAQEQYDLLLNFANNDERLDLIMDILQSVEFRREVEALGGYDLSEAGKLITCGVSKSEPMKIMQLA
jgi:putative molybdopterin biosynthesis protein